MAFFIRKKKKEENIQEIKDAVEGKKIPEEVKEKPEEKLMEEIEEEMSGEPIEEILEENEEEITEELTEEIPKQEGIAKEVVTPKQEFITEPVAEITELGKPFAPLFVKLDRYKSVLNIINELKSTIISIKNSLEIQRQIENLKNENRELLEKAIIDVDEKVLSLDSEFLRPKGLEEEMPEPKIKKESLQGVVSDLKKQIESLKEELKTMS